MSTQNGNQSPPVYGRCASHMSYRPWRQRLREWFHRRRVDGQIVYGKRRERALLWTASHLPKPLRYWVTITTIGEVTAHVYPHHHAPSVCVDQLLTGLGEIGLHS